MLIFGLFIDLCGEAGSNTMTFSMKDGESATQPATQPLTTTSNGGTHLFHVLDQMPYPPAKVFHCIVKHSSFSHVCSNDNPVGSCNTHMTQPSVRLQVHLYSTTGSWKCDTDHLCQLAGRHTLMCAPAPLSVRSTECRALTKIDYPFPCWLSPPDSAASSLLLCMFHEN